MNCMRRTSAAAAATAATTMAELFLSDRLRSNAIDTLESINV